MPTPNKKFKSDVTYKRRIFTNSASKAELLKKVDSSQVIVKSNIGDRIAALSSIEAGWHYGDGKTLDAQGLNWFYKAFEQNFDETLPPPCLFPTLNGELMAEWTIHEHDISLSVDLNEKTGYYHELNHTTDEEFETQIKLHDPNGWKELNQKLQNIIKNYEIDMSKKSLTHKTQ